MMITMIVMIGTVVAGIVAGFGGLCYLVYETYKDGGLLVATTHASGWVITFLGFIPMCVLSWSYNALQSTSITEGWTAALAVFAMLGALALGGAMIGLSMDRAYVNKTRKEKARKNRARKNK